MPALHLRARSSDSGQARSKPFPHAPVFRMALVGKAQLPQKVERNPKNEIQGGLLTQSFNRELDLRVSFSRCILSNRPILVPIQERKRGHFARLFTTGNHRSTGEHLRARPSLFERLRPGTIQAFCSRASLQDDARWQSTTPSN